MNGVSYKHLQQQFDASYDRGQPFQFQIGVGQVLALGILLTTDGWPTLLFWMQKREVACQIHMSVRAQVIKGWDEGVMKMSLGEAATLKCSYDYAYGERGFPPVSTPPPPQKKSQPPPPVVAAPVPPFAISEGRVTTCLSDELVRD